MKLNLHKKKIVAPIVATICVILYYILYFGILVTVLDGILKYIFGIIPIIFSAIIVTVCVERIKEIKRGEEDNISKY